MNTHMTDHSSGISQKLRHLHSRWLKLPAKEKHTYTAAAVGTLVALYFVLIWPQAHTRLSKLEYDMEKLAVRERQAAKAPAAQVTPPPSLGGKNMVDGRKELDELHRQLERIQVEIRSQRNAFLPIDDSLAMNALKSGLTSLAETGDMEVIGLEHVYLRTEDKDMPPTPQMLQEAAERNPYKRPLLIMRAKASFRGLMQFLDGLSALPYVAAPVASEISVQIDRDPATQQAIRQWLDVKIKFAI